MQKWKKKGLIYANEGNRAQIPTLFEADDKTWRIFFSEKNSLGQSVTRYIDVEEGNPSKVLYEATKPVLPLGAPGTFDSSGIMPSWILRARNPWSSRYVVYLYYLGWSCRTDVPYQIAIGLAASYDEGKTFKKLSKGPIMTVCHADPYFVSTPCVIQSSNASRDWKAWYLSSVGWIKHGNQFEPRYLIKYAESNNGISWTRRNAISVDFKKDDEGGIARPSVIVENDCYRMWYCYRDSVDYRTDSKKSYRIGYAESPDGYAWERKDALARLDVSENGWDSQMICYPYVHKYKNSLFMFYNGNGFGETGIGYAVLK
jgi:hypothetical protein